VNDKDVLALQDQRLAAMAARDYGKLAAMIHDDLVYTHTHSGVDSKASWLEGMTSGRVTYTSSRMSDRKVRLYGDTAFITGAGVVDVVVSGQPRVLKLRFLEAWTKTPQGWKFVAWQSTFIPA